MVTKTKMLLSYIERKRTKLFKTELSTDILNRVKTLTVNDQTDLSGGEGWEVGGTPPPPFNQRGPKSGGLYEG